MEVDSDEPLLRGCLKLSELEEEVSTISACIAFVFNVDNFEITNS